MKTIKIKKTEFEKLFKIACENWKKKFTEKFSDQLFSDTLEFEESFLNEMESACREDQLPVFKKIFKDHFKDDLFTTIKTYADVCKKLKRSVLTIKDFAFLPEHQREKQLNAHKMQNIVDLFNGTWTPDWSNHNQYKYVPYFVKNGSRWVYFSYHSWCSNSDLGFSFYFKDSKTAIFVGKTFTDICVKTIDG